MHEFTPRRWHSPDGKWTYLQCRRGLIDILPGPNSETMRFLQKPYISDRAPKISSTQQHIHWAFKERGSDFES